MQNEKYSLKVEKVFQKPVKDVFRAVSEGRLFQNCGADGESMKIDFKVGGKYALDFKNYGVKNGGEFLEIIPNKKIVFTWCQSFDEPLNPDTKVTLEFLENGPSTRLTILHLGFSDKEGCDQHQEGWTSGATDLSVEMQGTLRLMRVYSVPVQKLYETCKNPQTFFGLIPDCKIVQYDFKEGGKYKMDSCGSVTGEFLKITPEKEISFTWIHNKLGTPVNSKVTLKFDSEDDGGSSLELIHEGLLTEEAQKGHRMGWEFITLQMQSKFGG